MKNVDARFEKLIKEPNSLYCANCGNDMKFKGSGLYVCSECDWEYISRFGKVKRYIEEHGPSTVSAIMEATGVSQKEISQFLADGRVEEITKKL